VLDETEFLDPFGIRALFRHHAGHPYVFTVGGQEYRVESDSDLFGGNSNWRRPIWMPVNALIIIIRALSGRGPVFGGSEKIQRDPHWRDHLLFYG
jgi:hypothetical protein